MERRDASADDAVATYHDAIARGLVGASVHTLAPTQLETRELGYTALAELAVGNDPHDAQRYLQREIDVQHADGTLPVLEVGSAFDANATSFGTQAWGPILLRYRGRLDSATRGSLEAASRRAVPALESYAIPVSYTNIALIQAVDVLLIGDGLGDRAATGWARDRLAAIVHDIRENGIHEYNSPNYYGADFDALCLGAAMTSDGPAKASIRSLLTYFWDDVIAHTVGTRTGGPSSRDYDFVGRGAGLGRLLALGNVVPGARVDSAIAPREVLHLIGLDELQRVPSNAEQLVASVRRSDGRYGPGTDDIWHVYAGRHVLLGFADGNYFNQDKPFATAFADPIDGIEVIPEADGDLYGLGLLGRNGARARPAHLLMNPVGVQRDGLLLGSVDLTPQHIASTSQVLTNIVIPTGASVSVDGRSVDLLVDQNVKLSTQSVVVVRSKTAAAAVRIAAVDGIDGFSPTLHLVSDGAGRRLGAARITATMFVGPARTFHANHARLVFLESVDDDRDAPLGDSLASARFDVRTADIVTLTAHIGATTLSLDIDPTTHRAVRRSIDGNDVPRPAPLAINGAPISI